MENLNEVFAANRALLARARELNTRAGESIFPVPSRDALTKGFAVALGGARRVAEIRNLPALLLPALDERTVEKVLREQPDTINVLGREVTVEYRSGYNPIVRIDFRGDEERDWLKIPDDGIHLPGGREVSMYSSLEGYGYYFETISSQFKTKVRECLNQGLWDKWQKPELPAPTDFAPPIVEAEYGRCVVTDVSLAAFGATDYDSYDGSWESHWSRDRAEIERVHAQACAKFVEVKEKVARDALKKRVDELYSAHNNNRELPDTLRSRMHNTYYSYPGGATTVDEMGMFVTEIEAAVAAIEGQKAEVELVKRESEARREAVKTALNDYHPEAHVWVPKGGEVAYILAGKTSKMGNFVVQPNVGDTNYDGPYCFGDAKYRTWVPFRLGVRSKAQDFSGQGNLQSEVSLFVPKDLLSAGVYGVDEDEEGQFFFPVIHHNANGVEVVPEITAIRKMRVTKEPKNSAPTSNERPTTDAFEALRKRWGSR